MYKLMGRQRGGMVCKKMGSPRATMSGRNPSRMKRGGAIRRMQVVVGASVRMKVRRLQRLVPGGRRLKPDRLFLQTADYILHLKLKLSFLQGALSKLYKASHDP